jgi:hypothetical protein
VEVSSLADIEEVTSIRLESVRTAENGLKRESLELLANTIQHVSTLESSREVVRWMVSVADVNGEKAWSR